MDEPEKEFAEQILKLIQPPVPDIDSAAVKTVIKKFTKKSLAAFVRDWTTQLECLLGIFESETLAFKDLKPGLNLTERQRIIQDQFERFLNHEYRQVDVIYEIYTRYLMYNSDKIEVEEILRENFSFILFKAIHSNEYYLDVVKNHSFAYWTETCNLPAAEAEAFIKKSGYWEAQSLVGKYKTRPDTGNK